MANPYFPTNTNPDDDYYAPIHAILGPNGQIMLFGYRQSDPQIAAGQQNHRTGSMAAVLGKDVLASQPANNRVTLLDRGENRDLSAGVRHNTTTPATTPPNPNDARYVESDPNDSTKEIFTDRLFCSGHTVLADGSILAIGGLRVALQWDRTDNGVTFASGVLSVGASIGGGTPFVQRWDWSIDNASWTQLSTEMAGYGNVFAPPTAGSTNITNWWTSLWPRPSRYVNGEGVFKGNERYYGTASLMLDGKVLIAGGTWYLGQEYGVITPTSFRPAGQRDNTSVELYDPFASGGTGSTTVLSDSSSSMQPVASATSPAHIFNGDYTHVYVLPTPVQPSNTTEGPYDLLVLGEYGQPFGFHLSSPEWYGGWSQRPHAPTTLANAGKRNNGSSGVLLPLRLSGANGAVNDWSYHNGSILYVGGFEADSSGAGVPSDDVDAFDPYLNNGLGSWFASTTLNVTRHHPNAVLLPDGEVVVVGGHNGTQVSALKHAEYIDPSNSFAVAQSANAMASLRAYHAVALLLPDGRVFVGGGRDEGPSNAPYERADYEILSPWYVDDNVARPSITFVHHKVLNRQNDPTNPANPVLSTDIRVEMPQSSPPAEAVMMSLGSMTHSYDSNQRAVQVALSDIQAVPDHANTYTMTVTSPEYTWAPPGYYMLFVLTSQRVPSPSAIVQLQ